MKEKIPLINSQNLVVKIFGYAVYGFLGLILLGILFPAPADDSSQPLTESDVKSMLLCVSIDDPIVVDGNVYLGVGVTDTSDAAYWSLEISRNAFKDPRVENVSVSCYFAYEDEFGNIDRQNICVFRMNRTG